MSVSNEPRLVVLVLALGLSLSACKKAEGGATAPASAGEAGDAKADALDPLAELDALEARMRYAGLPIASPGASTRDRGEADMGGEAAGGDGEGSEAALSESVTEREARDAAPTGIAEEAPAPAAADAPADEADGCVDLCDLNAMICDLEIRICALAADHVDDRQYADACRRAGEDCDVAGDACQRCGD